MSHSSIARQAPAVSAPRSARSAWRPGTKAWCHSSLAPYARAVNGDGTERGANRQRRPPRGLSAQEQQQRQATEDQQVHVLVGQGRRRRRRVRHRRSHEGGRAGRRRPVVPTARERGRWGYTATIRRESGIGSISQPATMAPMTNAPKRPRAESQDAARPIVTHQHGKDDRHERGEQNQQAEVGAHAGLLPAGSDVPRITGDEQVQQASDDDERVAVLVGHRRHGGGAERQRPGEEVWKPDAQIRDGRQRHQRLLELEGKEPVPEGPGPSQTSRQHNQEHQPLRPLARHQVPGARESTTPPEPRQRIGPLCPFYRRHTHDVQFTLGPPGDLCQPDRRRRPSGSPARTAAAAPGSRPTATSATGDQRRPGRHQQVRRRMREAGQHVQSPTAASTAPNRRPQIEAAAPPAHRPPRRRTTNDRSGRWSQMTPLNMNTPHQKSRAPGRRGRALKESAPRRVAQAPAGSSRRCGPWTGTASGRRARRRPAGGDLYPPPAAARGAARQRVL